MEPSKTQYETLSQRPVSLVTGCLPNPSDGPAEVSRSSQRTLFPIPSSKSTWRRREAGRLLYTPYARGSVQNLVDASTSTLSRHCPIPHCPRPNCNLRTHQQYYQYLKSQGRPLILNSPSVSEPTTGSSSRSESPADERRHPAAVGGLNPRINAFPKLPLADPFQGEFRNLLHYYFNDLFDRIMPLFQPPSTVSSLKPSVLVAATSSPLYCLILVAHAKNELLMKGFGHASDREAIMLYGKVTQTIREKLSNLQAAENDYLLLIIVVLAVYESIGGRTKALRAHRAAIKQLVDMRGGFANLGRSRSWILQADHLLAIFTYTSPLFVQPSKLVLPERPHQAPRIYGFAFQNAAITQTVDETISQFCLDTCSLIESFEEGSSVDTPWPSSDLHYQYFRGNCLRDQFPCLHAQYKDQQTLSRCVLLVTKILEFPVLNINHLSSITPFVASEMRGVLDALMPGMASQTDILSWILFVLAIAPKGWDGHEWAIQTLRSHLRRKYAGRVWDSTAKDREWRNARGFIWSDVHLQSSFDGVCAELDLGQELGILNDNPGSKR